MKARIKPKSISFKLGLLFSAMFVSLLLILGGILYGVFTNVFIDYIKQDLLARGNNHARILSEQFNDNTITHVVEMEKGVKTEVLITDAHQAILASSSKPGHDMKEHFLDEEQLTSGIVLESDWENHEYIITVSPIKENKGYVYMYYPSAILREIVFVMNVLISLASIGIILLAFGLIGLLSKRLTKPLLVMKEATTKMAQGKYQQKIPFKGEDEIAELGRSIQELGEQLQYYEDSRNEFLAAVSHELRTPLTYIKGYSDILSKGKIQDKQEQAEYLNIIKKEVERITFMINDLFEMSKLQVGKFELDKKRTDLNGVVEKVIANLKPAAVKKGLNLQFVPALGLPVVYIDAQRMEQVFYNLVENGIKYTSEGGIVVRTSLGEDRVMIEIRDTGIGIPENETKKIWDRFYRVDRSRTRKTGGTGLGLYVVKEIVEAHGGEVTVRSSEKEGTIFTVSLKLNQ